MWLKLDPGYSARLSCVCGLELRPEVHIDIYTEPGSGRVLSVTVARYTHLHNG